MCLLKPLTRAIHALLRWTVPSWVKLSKHDQMTIASDVACGDEQQLYAIDSDCTSSRLIPPGLTKMPCRVKCVAQLGRWFQNQWINWISQEFNPVMDIARRFHLEIPQLMLLLKTLVHVEAL